MDITKDSKVYTKQPKIDLSSVLKMFVDGVKNSLGAEAGVILKSQMDNF